MRLRTIFTTIALAFMIVSFTGCQAATAFLQSPEGQAVMDHGGLIAGVFVGSNNLDRRDEIITKIDTYLNEPNLNLRQAAMEAAYLYIYKEFGKTPEAIIVIAEVQKLAGIFIKDGTLGFLDTYKPELVEKFVLAFRNGVSLATPRKTKFIRR